MLSFITSNWEWMLLALYVLEKGIKTTVPQFIEVNDKIVVSTIDDTYIEKAK